MSLYLKYRPADFKNLVWQSFIKETLQKAIANDKTVWAYLFCWPRWTGKTSTARIFAKSVNCEDHSDGNPCLKCSVCTEFADEKLIDIIEIDAASVTWVDNIRDIIEKSQFRPNKTKFKVYIIDEVHMLSKWAFNALLKILEEPPEHVKFILATTETHKVPDTIISRCQRYDFKRISDNDIKDRLSFISKSEDIKTDEKSIEYIIKNSSGWLRNAISLFEQLVFEQEINYDLIVEKLEIVNESDIESFLKKLISKDSSVIDILDKNIADWKNIKVFFKELLFFTKSKALKEVKSWGNISAYINILDILDDTYTKTKHTLDENITFVIWILKILNWNKVQVVEVNNQPIKKTVTVNESVKNVEKKVVVEKNNDELSHDDLDDVFWDSSTSPEKKVEEPNTAPSNINFDTNTLIAKLKSNWAKWWLTMCMRWVTLNLEWETLVIHPTNRIQKWQVENVDNSSLIIKSLSDMWFANPNIKIK